jgi:hypothetical protein
MTPFIGSEALAAGATAWTVAVQHHAEGDILRRVRAAFARRASTRCDIQACFPQ